MISQSDFVENIRLQANLKKINFINFCTVKNIMIDITFNNANINIIQRVFLQKWRKIVDEDLELFFNFFILYRLKDIVLKINANKHVKTTLFDDQSSEESTMQFQVALNNDFDKSFLQFNIFNILIL
jgi:hypothetical protein